MIKQVALLICAVLTFSCHAWSQDTEIPRSTVFGIELGSNISRYKNAKKIEDDTGAGRVFSVPKQDFTVPKLFSEGYTFIVTATQDGTIHSVLIVADEADKNASKVVNAVMEAYPQVKKDPLGVGLLAHGEIYLGYHIGIKQEIFPPSLEICCMHLTTIERLRSEKAKKDAEGL